MSLKDLFTPPPEPSPPPPHEGAAFLGPFGLQRYHAHQALHPALSRQLYVGATSNRLVYTGLDEHLGMFAGPRSAVGKTTHWTACNLTKRRGTTAVFTSKAPGIIAATALARSAVAGGPDGVFHTCFDGPAFPGTTEARWSLIAHAKGDYDLIEEAIRQMASVSLGKGDARQAFWTESAIVYVSTVFTTVSILRLIDKPAPWRLEDPMGWTERFATRLIRRGDFAMDMTELVAVLINAEREDLADNLYALAEMPPETRAGIVANARIIVRPFNREKVVRTTDNPNMDLRRLVRGAPDAPNPDMVIPSEFAAGFEGYDPIGRWPTWYVTGDDQRAVAPWMALLASIVVRTAAEIAAEAETLRNEQIQPVLLASDELGTIAPIDTLPEDAAKGGNGYQFLAGFQSISQATDRYGKQIRTLLQNIALGPGLRDEELELFSKLNGVTYVEKVTEGETENYGNNQLSTGSSLNRDWLQVPRIPIDAIANGFPDEPGAFSYFPANSTAHQWVHSTPYFRSGPWFQMLVNEGLRVAAHGDEARLSLPLPVMHRHGFMHPSVARADADAYRELVTRWSAARRQKGLRP